jgi:hypothetical protein
MAPIEHARQKTGKVQEDLQVASAELGLAHEALERHLPPEVRKGDVEWAVGQNAAVEQKVHEAAQELEEVTELLHEEEAQRRRLEAELARRGQT